MGCRFLGLTRQLINGQISSVAVFRLRILEQPGTESALLVVEYFVVILRWGGFAMKLVIPNLALLVCARREDSMLQDRRQEPSGALQMPLERPNRGKKGADDEPQVVGVVVEVVARSADVNSVPNHMLQPLRRSAERAPNEDAGVHQGDGLRHRVVDGGRGPLGWIPSARVLAVFRGHGVAKLVEHHVRGTVETAREVHADSRDPGLLEWLGAPSAADLCHRLGEIHEHLFVHGSLAFWHVFHLLDATRREDDDWPGGVQYVRRVEILLTG